MNYTTTYQQYKRNLKPYTRAMTVSTLYLFTACVMPKASTGSMALVDPVCNMKIADASEAFRWKYKDKVYYFDTNACKESFKMNPEKFIQNSCNQVK
jgi:YHS domain-containing protein